MAHKEQGYRFRIDYDLDHRKGVVENLEKAIVIPVNAEIEQDHMVLNFDNVKKIVESAKIITVKDCSCRVDLKRCDAPVANCMNFNDVAEEMLASEDPRIQSYKPHRVSKEEAMDVLKKSADAGLVHMAYVQKKTPDKIGGSGWLLMCSQLLQSQYGRNRNAQTVEHVWIRVILVAGRWLMGSSK
jgi:hypothetical protein